MAFISSIIYLDSRVHVFITNLIYLNGVSLFLLIIYLLGDFFRKKRDFNSFKRAIEVDQLPYPNSKEQELYFELIDQVLQSKHVLYADYINKRKEQADFTQTWVHEIKTPIATLNLMLEVYEMESELKTSLIEEVDKIENYVDQALYLSRTEDFAKDYIIQDYNLNTIIKDIVKKNKQIFIGKHISLNLDNLDHTIKTDSKWLDFIVNQILGNSLKYTANGGHIDIYGVNIERGIELHIKDSGIGISTEDLPRIFDQGFTGNTGRNYKKSTGIGLYLSNELCNKLGHKLSADSKINSYTDICIFFPKLYDDLKAFASD
ncbi:MAG: sensor histidine kinase [Tissierellales bacterium]|jgi:signal transduction histidine kinase|nr:sensor histidine kinase [Tissierellales bacterium]